MLLNKISLRLALITVIIAASSCATTIPVQVRLYCPAPLELPKIQAGDLDSLTPSVYEKLVRRDRAQRGRIITLCEIIETTQ